MKQVITVTLYGEEYDTLIELLDKSREAVAHSDDPIWRDNFAMLEKRAKAEAHPPRKKHAESEHA